jgi:hypothetical protein
MLMDDRLKSVTGQTYLFAAARTSLPEVGHHQNHFLRVAFSRAGVPHSSGTHTTHHHQDTTTCAKEYDQSSIFWRLRTVISIHCL